MTTARDVIARTLYALWRGDDCKGTPDWKDMAEIVRDRWLAKADRVMFELAQAPEPVRMELAALLCPWRPKETAPKDGNDILLGCFGEAGHGGQFVAFWDDEGRDTYRWQTADGIAYHNDLPSHWLPLPAPPSEDKT